VRLILVRHGQAGRKSEWRGDDALRPLDAVGRRQAEYLAKTLEHYRHARIVSSPYLRCQQTVEQLSAAWVCLLELSEQLAPDAGDEAVTYVHDLIAPGALTVVLSTHREVLDTVLPALSTEFGVALGHRLPGAKGCWWVMEIAKSRLVSIRYHAPKK